MESGPQVGPQSNENVRCNLGRRLWLRDHFRQIGQHSSFGDLKLKLNTSFATALGSFSWRFLSKRRGDGDTDQPISLLR